MESKLKEQRTLHIKGIDDTDNMSLILVFLLFFKIKFEIDNLSVSKF